MDVNGAYVSKQVEVLDESASVAYVKQEEMLEELEGYECCVDYGDSGVSVSGSGSDVSEWSCGAEHHDSVYPSGIEKMDSNFQDDYCGNGILEFGMFVNVNKHGVREKFDTAASMNMSSRVERLAAVEKTRRPVGINGFNGSQSIVDAVGINQDKLPEYLVKSMPDDLALLCANIYVKGGAAILFHTGGFVVKLTDEEEHELKEYMNKFQIFKKLKVVNRTYEVDHAMSVSVDGGDNISKEVGYNSNATRYFNTKVNVVNSEQRILAMLLTGLSMRDFLLITRHKSVDGLPKGIDIKSLENFKNIYGSTPDIVTLAHPTNRKSHSGMMILEKVSAVGDRVEMDEMHPDYNVTEGKTTRKVESFGGAVSAMIAVDVYSGFIVGKLLKHKTVFMDEVEQVINTIEVKSGVKVKKVAADRGVVSQNKFEQHSTEVQSMLLKRNIDYEAAEAYNHTRGTAVVENAIRIIKNLMRMATVYVLMNPNFPSFGFDKLDIVKLWGELFGWAVTVANFKHSPTVKALTRYEVFTGSRPNFQNIRMLPIFSCCMAYRPEGKVVLDTIDKGDGTVKQVVSKNQPHYVRALYIGPSLTTVGSIRVVAKIEGAVCVFVTSNYTAVNDGGTFDVYKDVEQDVQRLISESFENKSINNEEDDISVGNTIVIEPKPVESVTVVTDEYEQDMQQSNKDDTEHDEYKAVEIPVVVQQETVKKQRQKAVKYATVTVDPTNSYSKPYMSTTRSRSERYKECEDLQTACFADWDSVEEDVLFFSFASGYFVDVSEYDKDIHGKFEHQPEEGYVAVRDGVPRTFEQALKDPMWGEPARKEWNQFTNTGAIVEVDTAVAADCIRTQGADLVLLFPVYEKKFKDDAWVYKVRLVGDGRTQHSAVDTYSATPSREEFLVVLHMIACFGWDYAHVDEIRAFLNSKYKGEKRVFAKFSQSNNMFEVHNAVYGLKTSPRDYQDEVATRLSMLGYRRLAMCNCMYMLVEGNNFVWIYDFVDDFIFTGNNTDFMEKKINEMRGVATTTEPIWNATKVLGLELCRDREKKIIRITMKNKIEELYKSHGTKVGVQHVPIPVAGYLIKEEDFAQVPEKSGYLQTKDIKTYMAIVGSLIWISGVRVDTMFAVMYLTWSTKNPRLHHLEMAKYCVGYLFHSKDVELVLGGGGPIGITAYSDASVGTATKGRSNFGNAIMLGNKSGSVLTKCGTTVSVHLSSFEAELDGMTNSIKSVCRVSNILTELRQEFGKVANIYNDNKAMLEFVKGQGVAKNVRHMELRMWYIREKHKQGNIVFNYMKGTELPVDKLTKLGCKRSHWKFVHDIMGHGLLGDNVSVKFDDEISDDDVIIEEDVDESVD